MTEKIKGISRRKFIKGMGGGVLGTTVLAHSSRLAAEEKTETPSETHEAKQLLLLKINGKQVRVFVEARMTLAELIRDQLQLSGTKVICNHAECGACTVLLDGQAVYACHMLALDAAGKEVLTIEGLLSAEKLHPIQAAFLEHDGFQCGFCTPGQIIATQALLLKNPQLNQEQVKQGLSGNICRCAAYPKIIDSVLAAAKKA